MVNHQVQATAEGLSSISPPENATPAMVADWPNMGEVERDFCRRYVDLDSDMQKKIINALESRLSEGNPNSNLSNDAETKTSHLKMLDLCGPADLADLAAGDFSPWEKGDPSYDVILSNADWASFGRNILPIVRLALAVNFRRKEDLVTNMRTPERENFLELVQDMEDAASAIRTLSWMSDMMEVALFRVITAEAVVRIEESA